MQAADVRSLVPLETQPAEGLEDAGLRLTRGALAVGVLDAQDERAVLPMREQPVEERGAGVPHMELARRARRKTKSHQMVLSSATACAAIASPRPTASTPSL